MNLKFPAMRREGYDALRALADTEGQVRHWLGKVPLVSGFVDSLSFRLDQLYEMSFLLPEPDDMVGITVHPDEVPLLLELNEALRQVLDEVDEIEPEHVLQHAAWSRVVRAARAAADRFAANGVLPEGVSADDAS